jgi:hypothetical protein
VRSVRGWGQMASRNIAEETTAANRGKAFIAEPPKSRIVRLAKARQRYTYPEAFDNAMRGIIFDADTWFSCRSQRVPKSVNQTTKSR